MLNHEWKWLFRKLSQVYNREVLYNPWQKESLLFSLSLLCFDTAIGKERRQSTGFVCFWWYPTPSWETFWFHHPNLGASPARWTPSPSMSLTLSTPNTTKSQSFQTKQMEEPWPEKSMEIKKFCSKTFCLKVHANSKRFPVLNAEVTYTPLAPAHPLLFHMCFIIHSLFSVSPLDTYVSDISKASVLSYLYLDLTNPRSSFL